MCDLVSIIVPVYNVKAYLGRCMDSLLTQTYQNIEILLVDDCSTDGSAAIACAYAENNPEKVVFVQREKNGGLSAARNSGISAAKGEWITFVDSDDWVAEDYVQTLLSAAMQDHSDIVMSSIIYYYSEDNFKTVSPFGNLTTESSHAEKVALSRSYACTRLFRRRLFADYAISFPEDIRRAEDMATIIPLLTRTERISIVPKAMYFYFQRATSLSNQNQKGTDVSFYPKTVNRMIELSAPGFEKALEFRAISELMYGMVMIMLRAGYEREKVIAHIEAFNKEHPNWEDNPYLTRMDKAKRIFVQCAGKRQYWILKALVFAWDLKKKIS